MAMVSSGRRLARWQKHTVEKGIHIANGEEQAKICRKLKKFLGHTVGGYILRATLRAEEAKVPLNYYPKDAKGPQASPCQNRPQEERQGGCQESLAREISTFPSLA
jgi:hypothetical protein